MPRELILSTCAAARLRAARRWLAAIPRDAGILVLGPHSHGADSLVQGDVAENGSRFGVLRLTLDRLAALLALPELARRGKAPCTSLSLAAVVARAVHGLVVEGRAGRYAEVARRPGFPHAVVRTLEELRAAGIAANELRSVELWGPNLAAIIDRSARELEALGLADRAEMLALARAEIDRQPPFPRETPILLLDPPLSSRLERELIETLVARAEAILATAPWGDGAAIAQLESMLGVRAAHLADEQAEASSLALLQRHLFEDSTPKPRPLDGTVSLLSWPGEARECVEIARRIHAEAARGVPFDRMAVLLRSPGAYRAHMEEALRRASIPAYFARGTRRPDPAGRALLALLACAAEGFSARRFAEYLSLAEVPDPGQDGRDAWVPPEHDLIPAPPTAREEPAGTSRPSADRAPEPSLDPEAPVHDGTLRTPWRWERLLVDAAVIGGKDRWRRRLDGLVQEIAVRRSEIAEEDARHASLARLASDLEHLRAFALPLIERLDALPREATWSEWLEHLRGLIDAAIRHPAPVRAALAELEPLGPVGPVDLDMVQHVLAPRLRELTVVPEGRPGGAVFIAPIEMARGLEFELVFVPGLAEKLFPPRMLDDPLLPDEARAALDAPGLLTQDARAAAERLMLRLAVGAATRHVALSWPRIDLENARPRVPSFYGLEVVRAAVGELPGFDELRVLAEPDRRARPGWPAPDRPEDAIDETEYDLAVLSRVQGPESSTAKGAAHYLLGANPHLARALRARGRRWLKRWTPADGLVDPDAEALAALASHRMGARAFSPTALEHFAACPYRFLLQAIHRLRPREDPEPLETIDPLTRGALFHAVQFEVLTALRDEGRLPLDPGKLEPAFARLDAAIDRVAAEYRERLAPAIPRVWQDGVNAIRADLREWLRRAAEGAGGWVPHRFELSFGLAERDRPTSDSASVPDAVPVLDGVLLRGSIDLVERRRDGTLRVTDHKTGKARVPAGAVVWGGQTLQPVLYGLAAEALLGGTVESSRLYYCTADGEFTERAVPLDAASRSCASEAIGVIARALEEGFLPAMPAKDACRWCDYRLVCGPHEEDRTARKPPDRLGDLTRLRGLP